MHLSLIEVGHVGRSVDKTLHHHFVTLFGHAVGHGRYFTLSDLVVELHHFDHNILAVLRVFLIGLGAYHIFTRFGGFDPSFTQPPIHNRQAQTQTNNLLIHRIFVSIFKAFILLSQSELGAERGRKPPVRLGFGDGLFGVQHGKFLTESERRIGIGEIDHLAYIQREFGNRIGQHQLQLHAFVVSEVRFQFQLVHIQVQLTLIDRQAVVQQP